MTDTVVVIPTYNNAGTLADVINRTLAQGLPVVVVNDGSTDGTADVLMRFPVKPGMTVAVLTHTSNRGKGAALKTAFRWALNQGYSYAVTIDSDGQHFPEDIPALVARKGEKALVVGSRRQRGGNSGGSFANRFSNLWFRLYTGVKLSDTQTGFRLYPLEHLPALWVVSSRYEAELSLLVFSAWRGVHLVEVPVRVDYPQNRVTHFRPFRDFARITVLNTVFLPLAIFYGYPRRLLAMFAKNRH